MLLAVALAYGYFAQQIPLDFWSLEEPINARTLPYLLAGAGTVLSSGLIVLLFLPAPLREPNEEKPFAESENWRSLCMMMVLMALFAVSIEVIGFVASSVLLLIFGFLILGSRSPAKIFAIAIPLVLVIWLVLDALGIYLAEGTLFLSLVVGKAGQYCV